MAAREGIYSHSYFSAAGEHLKCAVVLHQHSKFGMCHYLAGLAVECHLRSIIAKKKLLFDEHHDLKELIKSASYWDFVPHHLVRKVNEALILIQNRWRNSHRYRSEDALGRFLKLHKFDRGVKGNLLKASSADMINAAYKLITRGDYHGNFTQTRD